MVNSEGVAEEIELLREIAKWTREGALPAVRDRVVRLLDSDLKKRVYEAIAEGSLSYRALEKATGVNRTMARAWVVDWEDQRIAEPGAAQPRAMFTLRELGIPPAPPKAARQKTKAASG